MAIVNMENDKLDLKSSAHALCGGENKIMKTINDEDSHRTDEAHTGKSLPAAIAR